MIEEFRPRDIQNAIDFAVAKEANDKNVNCVFRYPCNSVDAGDSRRDSYIFAKITADSRQQELDKWGTKIRLRSEDARNDYETILVPSQKLNIYVRGDLWL